VRHSLKALGGNWLSADVAKSVGPFLELVESVVNLSEVGPHLFLKGDSLLEFKALCGFFFPLAERAPFPSDFSGFNTGLKTVKFGQQPQTFTFQPGADLVEIDSHVVPSRRYLCGAHVL
jgi:hypothetical protein